jgi:phytoene dehydrogenase-like protein
MTTQASTIFHTVIFGSGLAGLSCARKLALAGKKVCVIEKSSQLGGHLPSFQRKGVHFEVGIHYIASTNSESLFGKALRELNIAPQYNTLDNPFERLHSAQHKNNFFIQSQFSSYISDLVVRFPQHKKALHQFERDANSLWDLANQLEFPLTNKSLAKAVLQSPNMLRFIFLACLPLQFYLKTVLRLQHNLTEIISIHHTLIGVNPQKLSAIIYLLVHRYYFEAPCFPEGGGHWFTNAFIHENIEYLTKENAKFETCSSVPGARFQIKTSRGDIFARNVVWTPDPKLLPLSSPVSMGFWKNLQLKNVKYPHALAIGYFATHHPLQDLGMSNANHWLMGNMSSSQCYSSQSLNELAQNAPIYLSTGSLRDKSAIEPDNPMQAKGVFQAMFLVPTNSDCWQVSNSQTYKIPKSRGGSLESYEETKSEVLEILKNRIVEAFPLVKDSLCCAFLGSPLTHERYLFSRARNGYGFAATVADFLLWRPSYKTSTPGLYLCGAHIKPAHGIATALLNGVGLAKVLIRERVKKSSPHD